MKRLTPILPLILCFAAVPVLAHATPDKLGKDDRGVTVTSDAYITRVEVWSDRVVRVTRRPVGPAAAANPSLAVIAKPETVHWRFADEGDYVSLRTSALDVRVDKAGGAVRFLNPSGAAILTEAANGTSLTPATVAGAASASIRRER
jgi:alpha-D-xyloside xylohydrolase